MRTLGLLVLTIGLQSVFSGLLPDSVPPPDLFFLLALVLAVRQTPSLGLLTAFALGLFQDLAYAGNLGVHAMGLLWAVYAYLWLSHFMHWEEPLGRFFIILMSFLTKWFGYMLVVYWLRFSLLSPTSFVQVFLPELLLTMLLSPLFFWLSGWVLGRQTEKAYE